MIPLHEEGNPNDTDNYRGIAMVNVSGKVITSILNRCLTERTESNNVLSE